MPRPPSFHPFPPPRRRLGQHFLSDPRILARLADALELRPGEAVVEIGPGRGALTEQLRARAAHVIAIELDRALAAALRERYAADAGVRVIEGDALALPIGELAAGPYALAGNIPYYITTPLIFHALHPPRPARAVLLVQQEVADRLAAAPGSAAYGALSVNVQAVCRAERLFAVGRGSFHPVPAVESAAVRLTPRDDPEVAPAEVGAYRALVQGAFGLRRKQMVRVVRTLAGLDASAAQSVLETAGIESAARPETLTPGAFARLLRALPGGMPPRA